MALQNEDFEVQSGVMLLSGVLERQRIVRGTQS